MGISSKQFLYDFFNILRKYKNYKLLSDLSGIPLTTIQSWVYDDHIPSIDKVAIILDVIGYKVEIKKKEI